MSINGSINGLGTINNNYSSLASRQTIITNTTNSIVNNNNRSTLTSSTTMDWTNNQTNDILLNKSKSMPKLDDINETKNTDQITVINKLINDLSSSPNSSRSRSISSDDHGFGSASLSQLSGSPKIEYAYARKRLYPSIPNRTFICVKSFKPTQPGELELKKGDIVEVLSVGDSGYWEGRCNSSEGWFKATCVEEFQISKTDDLISDSIVLKRKTLIDLITHNSNQNNLKTVVLQRGKKGFGFVLRGAKLNDAKFEPSLEVPALQFLESVDKDSNADKAGLKPLDFVLEINGVDVSSKTHFDCVKLIKKTGDTLALKVYTVDYSNKQQSNQQNLISTSIQPLTTIYQAPVSLTNVQKQCSTASYYAAATISATNSVEYYDGTKSLPNKKKR